MACGRCECGRRSARRVTQAVGVMQHWSVRGKLGRQEFVEKVVVWGRGRRGMQECGLRRVPQVKRWALRWKCGRLLLN